MATPEEQVAQVIHVVDATLLLLRAERYRRIRDVSYITALVMAVSAMPMPTLIPTIWDTIQRPYFIIAALAAAVGLLFTLLLYRLKRQNEKAMAGLF